MFNTKTTKRLALKRLALTFTPYAWQKLVFFQKKGKTEISGFGVAESDNPLLVTDFITVKQETSAVSIAFDDKAIADFFEKQADNGLNPSQFARIWIHTHLMTSVTPSGTDDDTFAEKFGDCDWAVMCIIGEEEKISALLYIKNFQATIQIPVSVDFNYMPDEQKVWENEFNSNIKETICERICNYNNIGIGGIYQNNLYDPYGIHYDDNGSLFDDDEITIHNYRQFVTDSMKDYILSVPHKERLGIIDELNIMGERVVKSMTKSMYIEWINSFYS